MGTQAGHFVVDQNLDEKFDENRFATEASATIGPDAILRLDLGQIQSVNSAGMHKILTFFSGCSWNIELFNVPERFIVMLNLTSLWNHKGVLVKSFFAPVWDKKKNKEFQLLIQVGKDIPIKNGYTDKDIEALLPPHLEAAFHAEEYLHFLHRPKDGT